MVSLGAKYGFSYRKLPNLPPETAILTSRRTQLYLVSAINLHSIIFFHLTGFVQ